MKHGTTLWFFVIFGPLEVLQNISLDILSNFMEHADLLDTRVLDTKEYEKSNLSQPTIMLVVALLARIVWLVYMSGPT